MYNVSSAYKTAMHNRVQKFKVRGTVGNVSFSDENILAGSLSISNQCSGSDNIDIGQVYIGEMNCTFLGVDIERNSWYGKEVTIDFGQCLDDGSYEFIPLGVFIVAEANYTESGVVVKAYDHMAKLDKACSSLATGAKPYNLAKLACSACGVALETSEATFLRFPNGKATLALYAENDIATYRDALSWIAQACCCFVTASRTGGIIFRQYGGQPVDTIDDTHRFTGCTFSDFSTRYTGLSVVNIEKRTTSYYAVSPDNGLTYNLGSNPYLQNAVSHSLSSMREAVLKKLAEIDYVPFKAACIGNPAYDLGDVLVFSNGIADGEKQSVITKFTWTYGRDYVMEGVGGNPALATGNSKSDKNIAGLISQTVADETFRYTVLTNGADIAIQDGEAVSVIFARYLLSAPSHVRFNFEILLSVTADEDSSNLADVTIENNALVLTPKPTQSYVTVKAIYKADGDEIVTRYPVETMPSGRHILTLQYDLDLDDSLAHSFDLWLEVSGGEVAIAENDAYEVISSTGLAADNNWEGTFRDEDGNLYIVIDGAAHKIPDSITVFRYPSKMSYIPDEQIDYSGLVIHALFGDGSHTNITDDCNINPVSGSPFDGNQDMYIEVSYTVWTVSYGTGFHLTHNYITDLIITPPMKTDYRYGEILDYTGLAVEAVYRDGRRIDVTEQCVITPAEGTAFDYYR